MPTFQLSGPYDAFDSGVWIPSISLQQYGATLASWFGVAATNIPKVFPQIVVSRAATSDSCASDQSSIMAGMSSARVTALGESDDRRLDEAPLQEELTPAESDYRITRLAALFANALKKRNPGLGDSTF